MARTAFAASLPLIPLHDTCARPGALTSRPVSPEPSRTKIKSKIKIFGCTQLRSSTACRRGRPQNRPRRQAVLLRAGVRICRSALARDGGLSVTSSLPETPPSPASSLPRPPARNTSRPPHQTRSSPACRRRRRQNRPRRQAVLLRAGVRICRSALARDGGLSVTSSSPDTPPSRASSLPRPPARNSSNSPHQTRSSTACRRGRPQNRLRRQAVLLRAGIRICRSALARDGGLSVTSSSPATPPSRASSLPRPPARNSSKPPHQTRSSPACRRWRF